MSDLRDTAQQALKSLRGYRRELGCQQPCDAERALEAALEQPEQEPVAWIQPDHLQKARRAPFSCRVEPTQRWADFVPLFTHPPRREWQSLTEEEIMGMTRTECADMRWPSTALNIARAIEAALKEKNND